MRDAFLLLVADLYHVLVEAELSLGVSAQMMTEAAYFPSAVDFTTHFQRPIDQGTSHAHLLEEARHCTGLEEHEQVVHSTSEGSPSSFASSNRDDDSSGTSIYPSSPTSSP